VSILIIQEWNMVIVMEGSLSTMLNESWNDINFILNWNQ